MSYPKLWNGASPVGEALVRALNKQNAPYLSAHAGDQVVANKMKGYSEVFVGSGGGGFLCEPVSPSGPILEPDELLHFKPKMSGNSFRATPVYRAIKVRNPQYGDVDWQGSMPENVLSWKAWSWMGPVTHRYDPLTQQRANKWFYDVMKSNFRFEAIHNFWDRTWALDVRDFITPTLRYQCVGGGLTVYRNRRVWRQLLETERVSDKEWIQGAALSSHEGKSGCFIFLRENDTTVFDDGHTIRAGWLEKDGTFSQTHSINVLDLAGKTVQGWYFNRSGTRALCVFDGCTVLQFTHEGGFQILEWWIDRYRLDIEHPLANSFMLGRDFVGDEVVKLDIEPCPHPHADFVGRTMKRNEHGKYEPVEWRIPQRRWDYKIDEDTAPWFASRALDADLRTGTLLCIEQTFEPFFGSYEVPWDTGEWVEAGTERAIILAADFVVYQHGEEVLRKSIPM